MEVIMIYVGYEVKKLEEMFKKQQSAMGATAAIKEIKEFIASHAGNSCGFEQFEGELEGYHFVAANVRKNVRNVHSDMLEFCVNPAARPEHVFTARLSDIEDSDKKSLMFVSIWFDERTHQYKTTPWEYIYAKGTEIAVSKGSSIFDV